MILANELTTDQIDQIVGLVADDARIEAIKMLRRYTNIGLYEAKVMLVGEWWDRRVTPDEARQNLVSEFVVSAETKRRYIVAEIKRHTAEVDRLVAQLLEVEDDS